LHKLKKMKNNNFSLNNVIKITVIFSLKFFCKLKKSKLLKSLVHAVVTLNSNILRYYVGVLYNGDIKNIVLKKTYLKFDNMYKTT